MSLFALLSSHLISFLRLFFHIFLSMLGASPISIGESYQSDASNVPTLNTLLGELILSLLSTIMSANSRSSLSLFLSISLSLSLSLSLSFSYPLSLNLNLSLSLSLSHTLFSFLTADASPGGGTPLCYHVNQVAEQITLIAPQLRAAGIAQYASFNFVILILFVIVSNR